MKRGKIINVLHDNCGTDGYYVDIACGGLVTRYYASWIDKFTAGVCLFLQQHLSCLQDKEVCFENTGCDLVSLSF